MKFFVLVALLVLIAAFTPSATAESFASTIIYSGSGCSGTPLVVSVVGSIDCEAVECVFFIADSVTYSSATTCESTDRQTFVADAFATSSYVMIETFTKMCQLFMGAIAFLASGKCQVYDEEGANYVVAKVNEDGSANVGIYDNNSCTGTPFLGYTADNETVSGHSCYKNYSVIFTGTDSNDSDSPSSNADNSVASSTQRASGSFLVDQRSTDDSGRDSVGSPTTSDENGSEDKRNATVSITPSESSGGVNTGAIIGILVAYVMLCTAACILCMDRMERLVRRLGLRR